MVVEHAVDTRKDRLEELPAVLEALGTRNRNIDPLRRMFGSLGVLTRPAGCSEIRHGRALGKIYHQLRLLTLSHGAGTHSFR